MNVQKVIGVKVMYAKVKDNEVMVYPYTMETLQNENPHTKFDVKKTIVELYDGTEDQIATGCTIVEVTHDNEKYCPPNKEMIADELPHINENGNCVIGYTQVLKESDAFAEAEQAVIKQLTDKIANSKIEYAHTIAADSTLSSELQAQWVEYFNSLDNISSLEGYPYSFTFPTRPPEE